ncbi:MAG: hypothetical protein M1820_003262 [Bogoriella megaspora]|nr:MAG: hypothetical protein M1820_003262 [Bogoriella megaspora]
MPEHTTSALKPEARGRRPPKLVAGEVTRKIGNWDNTHGEESLDPPPTFDSRNICGAKNFLDQDPIVTNSIRGGSDSDTELKNLGGVTFETYSSQADPAKNDDASEHLLTAPAGWQRFWGSVREEYFDDPDVILSPFCKPCYDADEAECCRIPRYERYTSQFQPRSRNLNCCKACRRESQSELCLNLITYRSPTALSTYKMRLLDRSRADAESRGLALPTGAIEFSPIVRLPPKIAKPPLPRRPSITARSALPTTSQGPTYSRVRDSYHELKHWAMGNSEALPLSKGSGSGPGPKPIWIYDQSSVSRYLSQRVYMEHPDITRNSPLPEPELGLPIAGPQLTEVTNVGSGGLRERLLREMTILCALSSQDVGEGAVE